MLPIQFIPKPLFQTTLDSRLTSLYSLIALNLNCAALSVPSEPSLDPFPAPAPAPTPTAPAASTVSSTAADNVAAEPVGSTADASPDTVPDEAEAGDELAADNRRWADVCRWLEMKVMAAILVWGTFDRINVTESVGLATYRVRSALNDAMVGRMGAVLGMLDVAVALLKRYSIQ